MSDLPECHGDVCITCSDEAVQVRVVIGPAQFEPATVSTKLVVIGPQALEKVGMPVTEGSMDPGQGTVMSGGQVPVGTPPVPTVRVV